MTPLRVVYCNCTYAKVVPKEVKDEVLRRLIDSGIPFDAVPDLCEMSAKKDPCLQELAGAGPVKIAACYPRAVEWLFAACKAPLPKETTQVLNMRTETADAIIEQLLNQADA